MVRRLGTTIIGNKHALAPAFFILLTLVVSWPLALHLTDRVPGWFVADNYEYLWKMWWFKHALLDLGQNPLFAPDIFYPQGFDLAHAELTPLHTVLGLPLTWALGEIFTYNLFAILSFIVAGWATHLLVHGLTGDRWSGALAGTLFILAPYHTVRYGGILPLMAVEGIPLFFLGLERWVSARQLRWGLLASAGLLLAAWASPYYAFGLAMLFPVYLLARLRPLKAAAGDRRTWELLILLASLALLTVVPLAIPYWQLSREIPLTIPLEQVGFWSASPTDYLLPTGLHPLWGTLVREKLLSIPSDYPQLALEFVLSPGLLALVFAAMGSRYGKREHRRAYVALTLVAALLSFGPRLQLGRHPVVIPAPRGLVEGFNHWMDGVGLRLPSRESYRGLAEPGLSLPLPALALRWLLPPLKGLRAWNRFAGFVSLGAAVLAGLGMAAWIRREVAPPEMPASRARRRSRAAGLIVLALAVFELWPGSIPLQEVRPRPVDEWLAQQPGEFTIMELPLVSALSAPQMLYTRYHGKRTAFAYGTYFPMWYRGRYPEMNACPGKACLERLREWEVRYVLLNRKALEDGSRLEMDLDGSGSLQRVIQLEAIVVYRLLPPEGGE